MHTGRINELMAKAEEELHAVDLLVNGSAADWIVGFHCQQVAEKTLKAVLVSRGQAPAMIHDLVHLMDEARRGGTAEPPWFRELEDLNPFAVQLRYEYLHAFEDFNADHASALAHRVYHWAEQQIGWSNSEATNRRNDEGHEDEDLPKNSIREP